TSALPSRSTLGWYGRWASAPRTGRAWRSKSRARTEDVPTSSAATYAPWSGRVIKPIVGATRASPRAQGKAGLALQVQVAVLDSEGGRRSWRRAGPALVDAHPGAAVDPPERAQQEGRVVQRGT